MKKILLIICIILLPGTVLGFTDNSGVPTTNNTPIPINTSDNLQVKTGALASDSYLQADVFYDRYNSDYYMQPRGTNILNYVVADNTLTYGEVQGAFFRDRNNGGFYLDPNGVSILNDIRPTIIYDRNNTGYYLDPSGNSRVNRVLANDLYSYGYANVRNIYLRDVGRWASDLGRITTSIHSVPITGAWQYRTVSAQYCAISGYPSWTFDFYDVEGVHCIARPQGGNRWLLQVVGYRKYRIYRGELLHCEFSCINP